MPQEQPFRFLSDEEFFALTLKQRAAYLVRASDELEKRQQLIREQIKRVREISTPKE